MTAAAGFAQDTDRSHTPSTDELVERLERAEESIRELQARSNPFVQLGAEIAPLPDDMPRASTTYFPRDMSSPSVSVTAATSEPAKPPTVKVGGIIHIDSTLFPTSSRGIGFFENPATGDDPENRLEFRRLRLEVFGDLIEDIFYKLDIEFANPNDPQLRDAYIGFREVPIFQTLLIGNLVRPLSYEVYGSSNSTIFMEDALVFGESDVDSRRLGVLSRGYTENESLNWQFGVFESPILQDNGELVSDSLQGSIVLRVSGFPWYDECPSGVNYGFLGITTAVGNPAGDARLRSRPELRSESRWIDTGAIADSDWTNATGIDAIVNFGPFSVGGSWTGTIVGRSNGRSDVFFHGGNIYASYFLTGESQLMNRQIGVLSAVQPTENFSFCNGCGGRGAWQIAARVSYFDLNDEDVVGGTETNFTLGLNWWLNAHSRVMFNYVIGNIDDHTPVGGFTGGHFSGLAMRMQIDF